MTTESFRKNRKGILLMAVSSVCVCIGQLFWKLGADGDMCHLAAGFVLYGTGALAMIAAYKFGSLSVLQPILSVNYVISLLIGYYILDEQLNAVNVLGVAAIISGVILIAGGD